MNNPQILGKMIFQNLLKQGVSEIASTAVLDTLIVESLNSIGVNYTPDFVTLVRPEVLKFMQPDLIEETSTVTENEYTVLEQIDYILDNISEVFNNIFYYSKEEVFSCIKDINNEIMSLISNSNVKSDDMLLKKIKIVHSTFNKAIDITLKLSGEMKKLEEG